MVTYLSKYLCLSCRKALKRPVEGASRRKCPHCESDAIRVGHKFKTPKIGDDKGWKYVQFMISNGFYFDSLWVRNGVDYLQVPYPRDMSEAKDFVAKYSKYAVDYNVHTQREIRIGR